MKTKAPLILGLSGVLALAACADPAMNGQSRTQQGAIAGAVVGGLIGAGESRDNAVKGAVLGAAAGAVAGNILDRQAQDLRRNVSTPGIQVVNHGSYLQVVMPEGVLFATDSAAVSGSARNDLYAVARNLTEYPNNRVQVVGHTDNTGSATHNQALSERRANAVADILASGGVSSYRLSTSGRGYTQPVASNDTAAGRAQNRRVEILIQPTR